MEHSRIYKSKARTRPPLFCLLPAGKRHFISFRQIKESSMFDLWSCYGIWGENSLTLLNNLNGFLNSCGLCSDGARIQVFQSTWHANKIIIITKPFHWLLYAWKFLDQARHPLLKFYRASYLVANTMMSEDFNSLDFIAFQADESRHKVFAFYADLEWRTI